MPLVENSGSTDMGAMGTNFLNEYYAHFDFGNKKRSGESSEITWHGCVVTKDGEMHYRRVKE